MAKNRKEKGVTMRIVVPYTLLTRDEALEKVRGLIPSLAKKYGGMLSSPSYEWNSNICNFSVTAKRQKITGTIEVLPDSMRVNGKLPFLVSFFEGQIRQAILDEANEMLAAAPPPAKVIPKKKDAPATLGGAVAPTPTMAGTNAARAPRKPAAPATPPPAPNVAGTVAASPTAALAGSAPTNPVQPANTQLAPAETKLDKALSAIPLVIVAVALVGAVLLIFWLASVAKESFISAEKIVSVEIARPPAPKASPAPKMVLTLPMPVPANSFQTVPESVFRIVPETASRRMVVPPTRRLMRHESAIDEASWIQFRVMDGDRDVTSKCRWESSNPDIWYLGGALKLNFGAGYGIPWPAGVFAGDEPGNTTVTASYQGKTAKAKLRVEP